MTKRKNNQITKRDRKRISKCLQKSVVYAVRISSFSSGEGPQCQFNFLSSNCNRIKLRQVI